MMKDRGKVRIEKTAKEYAIIAKKKYDKANKGRTRKMIPHPTQKGVMIEIFID